MPKHHALKLYAQVDNIFQPQAINNSEDNKLADAKNVKAIPNQALIEDHARLPLAQPIHTVITMVIANYVVHKVLDSSKLKMVFLASKRYVHLANTMMSTDHAEHAQHTKL